MIPSFDARGPHPVPRRVTVKVPRVLVAEAAIPVRRKLQEILHRSGVSATDVTLATTPEEALEGFARDHPGIVFAELLGDEPEAGLDMIGEMLSVDPQAKIVLVTAEDPAGSLVRRAVRMGVFAVVPKPLRHERIRAVMAEIEAEDGGVERYR